MNDDTTPAKRSRKYTGKHRLHGLHIVKRVVKQAKTKPVDMRTRKGKALAVIYKDMGGKPTELQKRVARGFVEGDELASRIFQELRRLPVVNKRKRDVTPVVTVFIKLMDTNTRTAALLGVKRAESNGLDLARRLMMQANGGGQP